MRFFETVVVFAIAEAAVVCIIIMMRLHAQTQNITILRRFNQALIIGANRICKRYGLAVPHAGDKSYVTGSIHGWSRSHFIYRVAADSKSVSSLRSLPQLPLNFQFNII